MSNYLPVIISAVLIIAVLLWWLLALDGVKKSKAESKDIAAAPSTEAPKTVSAPPVAATPKPTTAKLMEDPAPAKKTAKPKSQAPLKAAATKAAPAAKTIAKPAAKSAAPAKVAATKPAPKATVAKVAVAKAAAPKAAAPKTAAPKPSAVKAAALAKAAKPKAATKIVIPDNLELLKGVGPKVNNMLKAMGITSFEQVANWTQADITEIDSKLGAFAGRISRDNWVEQAKLLVAGDVAAFEKKYGALGSEVTKG